MRPDKAGADNTHTDPFHVAASDDDEEVFESTKKHTLEATEIKTET
jgi:hypothetical protein